MPSLEIPVCVVIDMIIITSLFIFFILFVHFDKMYLTIKNRRNIDILSCRMYLMIKIGEMLIFPRV